MRASRPNPSPARVGRSLAKTPASSAAATPAPKAHGHRVAQPRKHRPGYQLAQDGTGVVINVINKDVRVHAHGLRRPAAPDGEPAGWEGPLPSPKMIEVVPTSIGLRTCNGTGRPGTSPTSRSTGMRIACSRCIATSKT